MPAVERQHSLSVEGWSHNRLALVCTCNGWGPVQVWDGPAVDFQTIAARATEHMTEPVPCELCGTLDDLHTNEMCFK